VLVKGDWPTEKRAKRNAVVRARVLSYEQVDARDGGRCRCCRGWVTEYGTRSMGSWRERHHINGRGKLHLEVAANIITLCKQCHDWRHVRRTLRMSGDANVIGGVKFWTKEREWYG